MTNHKKKIVTFSLLPIMFIFHINAQQVIKYNYDNSGNRLSRKVILLSSKKDQTRQDKSGQESINELMDTISITIYPNPTRESLTISTQNKNPFSELKLYNTQGKLLYKDKNNNNTNTINMSMYDKGIYLLVITIEGKRKEFKVIKQ